MRLSQPGKPGLRVVAMGSDQAEAVTTPSRKSTDWPDPTRPRSGSSMPTYEGPLTTFHTSTCSKPLARFLERNSSSNGSKQAKWNMESFMQRSKELLRAAWHHRCWQISRCTGWKRLSASHMTIGANLSESVQS